MSQGQYGGAALTLNALHSENTCLANCQGQLSKKDGRGKTQSLLCYDVLLGCLR